MGRTRIDTLAKASTAQLPARENAPDVATLASTADGAKAIADWVNRRAAQIDLDGYDVGRVLNEAAARSAHRAAGYKSWLEWLDAEIRLARTTAYKYQAVALAFTREEYAELGQTRSTILVRLPEAQRRALLPEAKKLSTRALEAKVSAEIARGEGVPLATEKTTKSPAVAVALRAEGVESEMTKIGVDGAIAVIPGLHGSSITIVLGRDASGRLIGHVHAKGTDA